MFYGITLHRCGQCPPNLCRTNARPPLPGQERDAGRRLRATCAISKPGDHFEVHGDKLLAD